MKTPEQRTSPLKSPLHSECRPSTQMKSLQFRSIAPKAPTLTPPSSVVSCQPPATLPEAPTAASPKSIVVSAQNYALMRVAGQDGTFSLVAVSRTPPMQKNPKLPIPRYQPMRGKKSQNPNSSKVKKVSQTSPTIETDSGVPCSAEAPESASEPAGGEISASTSGTGRSVKGSMDPIIGYPTRASTNTLLGPVSNSSPVKVQAESPGSAGSAIAVLSPTIFGKAVQIVPSPPEGKIPILPYSKVKNSLLSSTGLPSGRSSRTGFSNRSQRSPPNNKNKTTGSKNIIDQDADATHLKRLPGKKRGRKRKTVEDVLTFEARKRRSLTFFSRRGTEKPSSGLQACSSTKELVDISKKYRSIRPKPVLTPEPDVPRLVPVPPRSDSEDPGGAVKVLHPGPVSMRVPEERPVENTAGSGFAFHRCSTCSRCFRFKHHLQSHMISHSNLRPYSCPVCRKAYVHSGSLSTHMNLHHSEAKPRKNLRCQFCEKAFGYVGVYFGHLREVHRVILTVEPSVTQHEDAPPAGGCIKSEDHAPETHPVELQIRCARCQAVTPTFTDMNLHLVHVHGQEVQVRLKGGATGGAREAENELVKHAAHYWRQLNQRRSLARCGSCDQEFGSFSKLKRHLTSHHQREEREWERDHKEHVLEGSRFNCVLCREVLSRKQEVLEHWRECHKCEDPSSLWEILEFKSVGTPHLT